MDNKVKAFLKAFDAWETFGEEHDWDLEFMEYEDLEKLRALHDAMVDARYEIKDES